MRKSGYAEEVNSYHEILRGCVCKSVVIALAKELKIKLHTSYKLGDMHLSCIEELPKEKPSFDSLPKIGGESVRVEIKPFNPTSLLNHTHLSAPVRSVPISLGFRTDIPDGKLVFNKDELAGAELNLDTSWIERQLRRISATYMRNYGASEETIKRQLFGDFDSLIGQPNTAATHARAQNLLKTNMAELGARIYATTYPSLYNDKIDFSPFANMAVDQTADEMRNNFESIYNAPEKPMRNFTVTRPVLVGNIDILTASDDVLVSIIRDAKNEQENMKDMVEVSAKFKAKSKELDDVIALCVEQLDKE